MNDRGIEKYRSEGQPLNEFDDVSCRLIPTSHLQLEQSRPHRCDNSAASPLASALPPSVLVAWQATVGKSAASGILGVVPRSRIEASDGSSNVLGGDAFSFVQKTRSGGALILFSLNEYHHMMSREY